MSATWISDKVLSWASLLDDLARDQTVALGALEFIHPHVALMPDAHAGLGASVGTVLPTKQAIIPAAVGVDIGCGMIAARTRYSAADLQGINLVKLRDLIEDAIPLSPGNYNQKIYADHTAQRLGELERMAKDTGVDLSQSPNWKLQLGSLGGGNHFIELCLDELDRVWCFLHSGSRGVGNKIAQRHITIARDECSAKGIELAHVDHAYLSEGTAQFDAYLRELTWAQHFALLNREEMMDRFMDQLIALTGDSDAGEVERINCHHNYTERIQIDGQDIWLSRKGAINAEQGRLGLIPGSMGDRSYIVSGLGNPDSLWSAPHGAGRVLSRTAARKRFSAEDLDKRMQGIVYRPGKAWVDEIPDAYKPIDQVMKDASDLVEVRHELRQIVNVKGK